MVGVLAVSALRTLEKRPLTSAARGLVEATMRSHPTSDHNTTTEQRHSAITDSKRSTTVLECQQQQQQQQVQLRVDHCASPSDTALHCTLHVAFVSLSQPPSRRAHWCWP